MYAFGFLSISAVSAAILFVPYAPQCTFSASCVSSVNGAGAYSGYTALELIRT